MGPALPSKLVVLVLLFCKMASSADETKREDFGQSLVALKQLGSDGGIGAGHMWWLMDQQNNQGRP